jgi:hypothetical protein
MLNSQSMCNNKRITFFLRHNFFNSLILEEVFLVISMQFNLGTFSWSMTEFTWSTVYICSQFMQATWIIIQMEEEKRTKVHAFISLFRCTNFVTKVMPFFFLFFLILFIYLFFYFFNCLFMWCQVQFLAISTGEQHSPAWTGSSVLQSVTCVYCSSCAEWQMWTYIHGGEWWLNYLLLETLVQ